MAENEKKVESKAAETDKAKKAKEKKPNIFVRAWRRITKWCREMKSELKKVQWPTRKQTVNNTIIVIVCVLVVGVFIWIFDALAVAVVKALINLFS
ncbi:MAG: preprotein translocase subunit SecE [Oscillospiraceae bacterium]|nr:preprotein translocase subunit SecE [Oscillospiraceae bacterium]